MLSRSCFDLLNLDPIEDFRALRRVMKAPGFISELENGDDRPGGHPTSFPLFLPRRRKNEGSSSFPTTCPYTRFATPKRGNGVSSSTATAWRCSSKTAAASAPAWRCCTWVA
ncbi:hypothetical protein M0R45_019221 [Rubus argutus]|uniref:Uncharacterized protein n=1 Tax=Rubus argutus TaxID=59490 RepID=A0AAW1X8A8_RUBAR